MPAHLFFSFILLAVICVMGHAELTDKSLTIFSHLVTYGHAADPAVTALIREEIETLWNEPAATLRLWWKTRTIVFRITAAYQPDITQQEILENTDPRNNYFRIEAKAPKNISFVDGVGCNTGYFQLDNLYKGSTTAAHEYGHTLGLDHPSLLDLRGKGMPGIMYPRGTVVDAEFQYNPSALAGDNTNGGTMHPQYRRVTTEDIALLKLRKRFCLSRKAVIGAFSSIWHPNYAEIVTTDNR